MNTVKNLQYDNPIQDENKAQLMFQQRNNPVKSPFNAFQSTFYNKYFKNTNTPQYGALASSEHNLENY